MSSNFLQRFKGKTQTISKDGVHNILGGAIGSDAYIYTHSNGLPTNQKLNSTQSNNMNASKNKTQQISRKPESKSKIPKPTENPKNQKQKNGFQQKEEPQKQVSQQNPFLISNPFYLDEEQRKKEQQQRLQQLRQQKLQNQKRKQAESQKDPKKGTSYSSMNPRKDSVSKKTEKQWVKMGGLGPNIGGEQWEQKKKKQEKMQQFAHQVKAINTHKGPTTAKTVINKREEKKDDTRTKALEYSKKIPKPVIRAYEKEQKQEQGSQTNPMQEINQNQMSELELYELRHKQLKEMLKNQL